MSRQRHGGAFDQRKRRKAPASSTEDVALDEDDELTRLRERCRAQDDEIRALHAPVAASEPHGVYNMQKAGEKQRLAAAIWTADFAATTEALRAANPGLVAVLASQTANTTPLSEISIAHKQRQLDGILLNVVRAQSIHQVPVLTCALSVLCEANMVKREFHDAISFLMKGALMCAPPPHFRRVRSVFAVVAGAWVG